MTLKKINQDHYIIVTDELPKNGDIYFGGGKIGICDGKYGTLLSDFKVIASTQKLYDNDFWNIQKLDLSYIKSLVGEVDVEKKAEDYTQSSQSHRRGFIDGYNQCLEDRKDKRFSEDDMRKIAKFFYNYKVPDGQFGVIEDIDLYLFSLTQPKDTWECFFDENNNLKLK